MDTPEPNTYHVPEADCLVGVKELARWLGFTPKTVLQYLKVKPSRLPPSIMLPGSTQPRWKVGVVKDWINQHESVQ